MKFCQRDDELKVLRRELELSLRSSRLAVISGRRGVGKTSLVLKACEESGRPVLYFFCTGKYSEEELARLWLKEVSAAFGLDGNIVPCRLSFAGIIRFVMAQTRKKPCVMILDECQELESAAPAIWADLQEVWDLEKDVSLLQLIMIGSHTSAMRRIFDDAGEPLFGRQDLSLRLVPFAPRQLKAIFLSQHPSGTPDDLLTLYAVTGGMPGYVAFLADAGALTRDAIVRMVFSEAGIFLRSDARRLLSEDLHLESAVYDRILRAMAHGAERWTEITDALHGQNIAGSMDRLEKRHGLVRKVRPLFSESHRGVRYVISDPYLRFWFRFVEPAPLQALAERKCWQALKAMCLSALDDFTELTLKDWYRRIYSSGPWTMTGCWQDRQGGNAIDLIALNRLNLGFEVAEIRRDPAKISLAALELKANGFRRTAGKSLKGFAPPKLRGLSLEDLFSDSDAAVSGASR